MRLFSNLLGRMNNFNYERKLQKSQNYFQQHLDELLQRFPDEYVAIIEEEVVYHHPDLGALTRHVYSNYTQRPIFMNKVEPEHEIYVGAVA